MVDNDVNWGSKLHQQFELRNSERFVISGWENLGYDAFSLTGRHQVLLPEDYQMHKGSCRIMHELSEMK